MKPAVLHVLALRRWPALSARDIHLAGPTEVLARSSNAWKRARRSCGFLAHIASRCFTVEWALHTSDHQVGQVLRSWLHISRRGIANDDLSTRMIFGTEPFKQRRQNFKGHSNYCSCDASSWSSIGQRRHRDVNAASITFIASSRCEWWQRFFVAQRHSCVVRVLLCMAMLVRQASLRKKGEKQKELCTWSVTESWEKLSVGLEAKTGVAAWDGFGSWGLSVLNKGGTNTKNDDLPAECSSLVWIQQAYLNSPLKKRQFTTVHSSRVSHMWHPPFLAALTNIQEERFFLLFHFILYSEAARRFDIDNMNKQ